MDWIRRLLARLGLTRARREPDPLEVVARMLEQQQQSLLQARGAVAGAVRARQEIEAQLRGLRETVARLEGQARQALAGGDEARARELLVRCEALEQQEAALAPDRERMVESEQRLLGVVRDTEARIGQVRARQRSLQGARDSAAAQAQLADLRAELDAGTGALAASLQLAEEEATRAELHAAALRELEESTSFELPGQAPAQLGSGAGSDLHAQLDARLARLRSQGDPVPAMSEPSQPGGAIPEVSPLPPAQDDPPADPLRTRMPPPPPPGAGG